MPPLILKFLEKSCKISIMAERGSNESFIGDVLRGSPEARKRWNEFTIRAAGAVAVGAALFGAPVVMGFAVAAGAVDKAGDEFFDSIERRRNS